MTEYTQKVEFTFKADSHKQDDVQVTMSFDPAVPGAESEERENMDYIQRNLQDFVRDNAIIFNSLLSEDFDTALAYLVKVSIGSKAEALNIRHSLESMIETIDSYIRGESN
jgi:hypothetical protein